MARSKKSRSPLWQRLDPFFEREKTKYGQAVPSREFIVSYLEQKQQPLTHEDLCQEWGMTEAEEIEALRRRLRAMERDGQLIRNRRHGYGVMGKMDLIIGRVIGHPEGYGFLVPDSGGDDLYISPRDMRQLLHGDRAVLRVAGVDIRGRREGALVDVLERNTTQVVGRFFEERGVGFVIPSNKRLPQDIVIPPEGRHGAQSGHIVVIDLIEQPTKHSRPIGSVKTILGDQMAPGMEVNIAIASFGIPTEWPDEVRAEIADIPSEVPESAKQNRVDLRHLPLVTIDGLSARDFDDAVYCAPRGQGWQLIVAIADVSWYVRPNSALDREARKRGTSVYFPDRVIPMLPEVLSNGLCSLNPQVDRLCLACDMTIDRQGRITRSRFVEAVMRSAARLTYDTVAAILVERLPAVRADYADVVTPLERLYDVYQVLHRARETRGAIDIDTQETAIEYGADGKIERIVPVTRNDAHRLIEECMIAANVAAARLLSRHRLPGLYRIHEPPPTDRLAKLRAFLAELGLGLGGGEKPTPKDYALLLERARARPDTHLIQTMLLRSLAQAVYHPNNVGHFGLAHELYAHFTSPIRRYPDLLVHRAIRHRLVGGKAADFTYTAQDMVTLGEHCSMTERRADEATRDALEWLKCEYMRDKVGDTFDGLITGVAAFGIFVELRGVFVEGLVHVTALPNDYYHFDPIGQRLQGERTGAVYRLGDALRVQVVRVNLDERKIDFECVSHEVPKKRRKKA